jgi:hypothetical protein
MRLQNGHALLEETVGPHAPAMLPDGVDEGGGGKEEAAEEEDAIEED